MLGGIGGMVRVNRLFSQALKVEISNIFTGTVPSLGITEEYASQWLLQWLGFVLEHKWLSAVHLWMIPHDPESAKLVQHGGSSLYDEPFSRLDPQRFLDLN